MTPRPALTLVESLDDLVSEVVDDLYLARFRQDRETPAASPGPRPGRIARDVVGNPHTTLTPEQPDPGIGRRGAGRLRHARCCASSSAASAGSASSATTTC